METAVLSLFIISALLQVFLQCTSCYYIYMVVYVIAPVSTLLYVYFDQ